MNFGEKMRQLRKQQGLTLEEVGERVGVGKSTVRKWESGQIANMRRDKIALVAKALNVTPSYLMGWEGDDDDDTAPQRPLPTNLRPLSSLHRQKVPLIGKVAAGIPIMAEQDYETYVDAPVGCDCALEVEGDSMVPTYQPGDIVYIKCQPVANEGAVAVVLIDDSATMKHIYHMGDMLMLTSDNQTYAPINVDPREHDYVAIYGIPVGYTRIYKKDPLKSVKKGMK